MKKLLKFGVASLSLATLGVVATAANLPVFGTILVHAEDGQVVDATVNHSQEGSTEVVNAEEDQPILVAEEDQPISVYVTLIREDTNRGIVVRDEGSEPILLNIGETKSISAPSIPGYTSTNRSALIVYGDERTEIAGTGDFTISYDDIKSSKYSDGIAAPTLNFYYTRNADEVVTPAEDVQTSPVTIYYLDATKLTEETADTRTFEGHEPYFSEQQREEHKLSAPERVDAKWTFTGMDSEYGGTSYYELNTTLKPIDGYRLKYWRKVGGKKGVGPIVGDGGTNSTISTMVRLSQSAWWSYHIIEAFYEPVETLPTDNTGSDTGSQDQTPPADTSGETGSQEKIPATDNGAGGTGTDTSTPPADAPKAQTLTVVETRQDENGEVLFTKTHSLVLNPGEEKDLGYNPDREVLVRGGNLYRYGNFEDGATLYFTTRLKPVATDAGTPADTPQPQTLTVVETRQDENGEVLFTKTHSLVLNPGEEKDLGYNPDREVLVRGGNLYRYGNFEDGATLYFTTRLKPATVGVGPVSTPAPTTPNTTAPTVTTAPTAPVSRPASADQMATTRNQLLTQVDSSSLTDGQKGDLAVKIGFAETAEELDKLKAELTSLTAPASKPVPASATKPAPTDQPAPSAAKTLPATGELSRQSLMAMGLSLVFFGLVLAKTRKTN